MHIPRRKALEKVCRFSRKLIKRNFDTEMGQTDGWKTEKLRKMDIFIYPYCFSM